MTPHTLEMKDLHNFRRICPEALESELHELTGGYPIDSSWCVDNLRAELAAAFHNARFGWEEVKLISQTDPHDYSGRGLADLKVQHYSHRAQVCMALLADANAPVTHEQIEVLGMYYGINICRLIDEPVRVELMHASVHPAVDDD